MLLEVFLPQCSHGNKETKKSETEFSGVHNAKSSVRFHEEGGTLIHRCENQ